MRLPIEPGKPAHTVPIRGFRENSDLLRRARMPSCRRMIAPSRPPVHAVPVATVTSDRGRAARPPPLCGLTLLALSPILAAAGRARRDRAGNERGFLRVWNRIDRRGDL